MYLPKKQPPVRVLGELEKEVMEFVWANESAMVRDVFEFVKKSRKIAYTTVMTIMDRLFTKKILKRSKKGKTYIYTAGISKNDFFKQTSRKIIRNLVQDFGDVALAQFVDTLDKFDARKLQELKDSINVKK